MSLQDEFVDIEKLTYADEIKIGDSILMETTDGTRLLDFKDLIIGVDNISFFDRISGDYLEYADISGLSAQVQTNSADILLTAAQSALDKLREEFIDLENKWNKFNNSITTTSIQEADLSPHVTSKVGFDIKTHGGGGSRTNGKVWLGAATTEGTELGSNLVRGSNPGGYDNIIEFSYTATGTYRLFLNLNCPLSVVGNSTVFAGGWGNNAPTFKVLVNNDVKGTFTATQNNTLSRGVATQVNGHIIIMQEVTLTQGDKITIQYSGPADASFADGTFSARVA